MTVKLARHRAPEATGAPVPRTSPRAAAHRGGLPPAVGTTVLGIVVLAALGVVVLGVLR